MLTYLPTYQLIYLPRFANLKMELTYIPTYSLIYLPCFCKRYNGAYLSIYLPRFANLKMELPYIPTYSLIYLPCFCKRYNGAYLSIDLPTDLCTYHASQTLKWSANGNMSNLPWKICFGGFRNRRRSKTEGGRQKRKTEIIAHLRFVASFFWASSMKSLSRFLSLVVVAFFFYNWSSCSRSHFCSLIFKHRDGEFCFSVLVL